MASLAAEVGLDADAAMAVLASGEFEEAVRAAEQEALELDIHAVPTFVVERRFAIPGAQDPETFVSALARMQSKLADEVDDATTTPRPVADLEDDEHVGRQEPESVADGQTDHVGERARVDLQHDVVGIVRGRGVGPGPVQVARLDTPAQLLGHQGARLEPRRSELVDDVEAEVPVHQGVVRWYSGSVGTLVVAATTGMLR